MPVALALVMVLPIHVHAAGDTSKALLARALEEAAAIWRDVGVELEWHTGDDSPPASLQVEVGDAPGRRQVANAWPLAWITFVNGVPGDQIYVSRGNALLLLDASQYLPRRREAPAAMITEYAGRAIGRSLAHEIGHYLFRSPVHDEVGVMGTGRSATELFGYERQRFMLTAEERNRLSAVLQRYRLAQRTPTPFE